MAIGDTIKQVKLLRDTLDTCFEMSKLLKFSPKRDAAFETLKSQLAPNNPGFRTLCPTRWTVRATFEGERIAQLTRSTLLLMRTDDNYELLWARLLKLHDEFAVGEPTMPRKRKAPARYEDGAASSEFPSCPKAYYKQIYYETLDLIVSFILQRFDQRGFRTYHTLQDLILNAAKGVSYEEELQAVTNF